MNKKINNLLNIRNIVLFVMASFFLTLASIFLFIQRYQKEDVIEYS